MLGETPGVPGTVTVLPGLVSLPKSGTTSVVVMKPGFGVK